MASGVTELFSSVSPGAQPGPSQSRGPDSPLRRQTPETLLGICDLDGGWARSPAGTAFNLSHHADYSSSVWFCGHTQWPEATAIQRLRVCLSRASVYPHTALDSSAGPRTREESWVLKSRFWNPGLQRPCEAAGRSSQTPLYRWL